MKLKFSKMHGLGNDFMVIDGVRQSVDLTPAQIRHWGDRHFGIGFDQLLLVEPPTGHDNDFRYRIFNNDGGEVEQCGNGARCFARFVAEQGLSDRRMLRVETARGVIQPELMDNGEVRVDMGIPRLDPAEIPFVAERQAITYPLAVAGESIDISAVSMGNPHAVLIVPEVELAPVKSIGQALQQSRHYFPDSVNVGFMQIVSPDEIRLRVYERGAGETLACGTGACAAVVAGVLRKRLGNRVRVHTHGGDLTVEWAGIGHAVHMIGPATTVFSGEIDA
ncbi:MAG: diaminopimelate epimerase [Paludibacterium sp.]|uniref:diaminopimelate epimerase n=1 Tax=Paludibacterium sp. TaxID=1917523 RepID=UPI0025FB10E0|nr:diaminopimelate epimerase [Paludibacterium sp.]MBV8046365.1 diaminopimelate epimerase [Paludibacterium sp.]MBV8645808.1 diaminopimelate epimerase [Paludibacterium sp.]